MIDDKNYFDSDQLVSICIVGDVRMLCFCCFLYLEDVAAKYNFEKKYFGQIKEFYIIAEVYYLSI